MEKQMNQTKHKTNNIKWGKLSLLIGLTILFGGVIFFDNISAKFAQEKTMYCHFENNLTNVTLSRYECMNMKIVSKEMKKIDLTQFDSLNISSYKCSENLKELPDCDASNYYISQYPLDLFCKDCRIGGYICIEYLIDYYSDNIELIQNFEEVLMQYKIINKTSLRKAFIECGE